MQRYKVKVKLSKIVTTYDTFYVEAFDERGAEQEALEAADSAYPDYDNATLTGQCELIYGDEE